ncbi:MAG: hypothetical protein NVSMB52_14660 [Chloroflexota bacterium]
MSPYADRARYLQYSLHGPDDFEGLSIDMAHAVIEVWNWTPRGSVALDAELRNLIGFLRPGGRVALVSDVRESRYPSLPSAFHRAGFEDISVDIASPIEGEIRYEFFKEVRAVSTAVRPTGMGEGGPDGIVRSHLSNLQSRPLTSGSGIAFGI